MMKNQRATKTGWELLLFILFLGINELLYFSHPAARLNWRFGWLKICTSIMSFCYFVDILTDKNRTSKRTILAAMGLLASSVAFGYFIFFPKW